MSYEDAYDAPLLPAPLSLPAYPLLLLGMPLPVSYNGRAHDGGAGGDANSPGRCLRLDVDCRGARSRPLGRLPCEVAGSEL